jgi:hypothetical protein
MKNGAAAGRLGLMNFECEEGIGHGERPAQTNLWGYKFRGWLEAQMRISNADIIAEIA